MARFGKNHKGGRPKGMSGKRIELSRATLLKYIRKDLKPLYIAHKDLAIGVVEKFGKKKKVMLDSKWQEIDSYYTKVPNQQAGEYLLSQLVGRPAQPLFTPDGKQPAAMIVYAPDKDIK